MIKRSALQEAIETVEKLSLEEQEILIDTIQKRLDQDYREVLPQKITENCKEVTEEKKDFSSIDEFLDEFIMEDDTGRRVRNLLENFQVISTYTEMAIV
ncbi:hypothetical protein cce_1071 [Crocosphaera subtropica ATCC 51142]|uniref:Uncharacterized protein n=1 Tax=Crocosphaera subtropica (strain ATCC 51142 / BH68) TaxID=43989 RepID=B1WTV6_CROS5|nr:hypothetical protein [Crocosphaera subtropica]ACB50422.1 hypothetical protein cce_1071 [Crocosphaera subtropica ATCC 51142]